MKLENIVLLGFVRSAIDYLEKEVSGDDLPQDVSLYELLEAKQSLERKIEASLGQMRGNTENLLESGREAFEKYLNERRQKRSIIDEFDDLFAGKELHENELDDLLRPYSFDKKEENDPDEEYARLIAEASQRAKEEDVNFDVDSLFSEVLPQEETVKEEENSEIDDIFREIVAQEEMPLEEVVPEEEEVTSEDYVASLVEDIRSHSPADEQNKRMEIGERLSLYRKINKIYPYLSRGFIRAVYDMKNSIAAEYPLNTYVIILHRLVFRNLEELRQFVEIVLGHNYNVNVDEDKMIVDVFKEHYNSDGKIITNIFEIANQAKLLHGDYDGYRVIVKEDE